MKGIGQLYAQYINKNYARRGYLWDGRFKSCLVESDDYLLRCYCYIELNPVRAGLEHHPGAYRWSSYAANARGDENALLTAHEQYARLGRTAVERQAAYRELIASLTGQHAEEIRTATNAGYPLGSEGFKRSIARSLGRRVEKGMPGRPSRPKPAKDQLDLL